MTKFLHFFSLVFMLTGLVQAKTVVVIDAGHGGKDPGAIGSTLGLKEKEVTLGIARELKSLLDGDARFKGVMTRANDYFIQLPNRTEIARKHRANYLVSIHADVSPSSHNIKGASVWVLSNRRANDEMGKWLEDHEKQSELLGGAGSVLSSNNERYINQTVLDLQFSHSQRTGYELGKAVLNRLSGITQLAKSVPQHASLSVLRSPDIPSILVEVGFLSTPEEEQRLATNSYRRQIAYAIYQGLISHREKNASMMAKSEAVAATTKVEQATKVEHKNAESKKAKAVKAAEEPKNTPLASTKIKSKKEVTEEPTVKKQAVNLSAKVHIVGENETLYSIATMYKTTPEKLSQLNGIKNNVVWVGRKIKLH